MACRQMLALLAVAVVSMAALPAMAGATRYMVGDDKGWSRDVNYTEWAQGKVFVVGDSLVFMYPKEKHNVLKVSGSDFRACNTSALVAPLESGNDTVPLLTAGRKWYICGKPNHCKSGQRLVINVEAPAPSPSPSAVPGGGSPSAVPGSSDKIMITEYQSLMVVAMAVLMTFMI